MSVHRDWMTVGGVNDALRECVKDDDILACENMELVRRAWCMSGSTTD